MRGREIWDKIKVVAVWIGRLSIPEACNGGHTPLMQALNLHLFAQYKQNKDLSEMRACVGEYFLLHLTACMFIVYTGSNYLCTRQPRAHAIEKQSVKAYGEKE